MNFVALDISASSTGWAVWMEGDIRPKLTAPGWDRYADRLSLRSTSKNWKVFDGGKSSIVHGIWRLKNEYSREGEPHAKLHRDLAILREMSRFEHIIYEKALAPQHRGGASNPHNDILVELIGHAKSFYFATRCRTIVGIHRASWQKEYIGSQKRGTKRKTLLDLICERTHQLGFTIKKDDEAAAIGLLTYGLLTRNITPPWIESETLRPLFGSAVA